MPATAWSSVVTGVVNTLSTSLTDASVVRGRDISGSIGDGVMVGVQSMDEGDWDSPGSFDQEMQSFGGARVEVGTVNGVAFSRDGGGDQGAATDAALTLIVGLAAALKATPALGITTAGIDYIVAELQTGELNEKQTEDEGAVTAVAFVVTYQARLT